EAYTTWLTGMTLLWIVYYVGAERYLIDSSKLAMEPWQAVASGLGFILAGFGVYEAILRTPLRHNGKAFGAVLFAFMVLMTWIACSIFSPRGAYIHVGALIGTIMAGNVFLGIMPSQRALVAAVQKGESPDPSFGAFAKLRSTHNNYFTLPLLFIMISNHYPITYSHEYNWLVLSAIGFITAFSRHFFNLRHKGIVKPGILIAAAALTVILAVVIAPKTVTPTSQQANTTPPLATLNELQAMAIIANRCTTCHAAQPTQAGFASAPAGVMLETVAQVDAMRSKIVEVTASNYMPLGNLTDMTDEERASIIQWLKQ
ncbi:MAG: urate hydroxylase PuuD, partial [Pseudomonadales bacterium]|nr:urate hydroxylase PuuD [Pseudomonadales bacterium]